MWRMAWPALVLALLLSLPWLGSPLFLDDWHNLWKAHQSSWSPADLATHFTFLDRDSITSWNLPALPPYRFFRPLVVASLKMDRAWGGLSPAAFHLTNLLLHLGCIFLVVALAFQLTGERLFSRLAGLFFAIQPQNAVAVVWTSGRTESLVALWMLAGLWLYIIARQRRQPLLLLAVLALQGLAFLSKESAVLLPLCALIYEWTFARKKAASLALWLRQAVAWLAPLGLFLLLYLFYRFFVFDSGTLPGPPYMRPLFELQTPLFVLAKTAYYLLALPTTAFIVPLLGSDFLLAHHAALLLLLVVVTTLYTLLARATRHHPIAPFAWLWLFLSFLPTMLVLATDLYLYFGSIGFALILAAWLQGGKSGAAVAADSAAPAVVSPWKRRVLIALLVLYGVGFFARGGFYYLNGSISERIYRNVEQDLGKKIPPGSRFYLINMPFAGSHLAPMLRLRQRNPQIHALMLTVSTNWTFPTKRPVVRCLGPRHLQLRPPAGRQAFFTTREEWNLQLFRRPFDSTRLYQARGATVRPVVQGRAVRALDLRLARSLHQGRDFVYVFFDNNKRLAHRLCHTP